MKVILFLITMSSLLVGNSSLSKETHKALIFGKTIRQIPHGEILPVAGPALEKYLSRNGVESSFTQSLDQITATQLSQYDVLILLDVSEGVLGLNEKVAIENFFGNGNGIVAIHATISVGKDWPWFQDLLGTKFIDHAPIQTGIVRMNHLNDSAFSQIENEWSQFDEWFNFSEPIQPPREIVCLSDESSYHGGKMGKIHPIAWRWQKDKGRFFYTSMGHPADLYNQDENEFLKMLVLATKWAANPQQK